MASSAHGMTIITSPYFLDYPLVNIQKTMENGP